MPDSFTDILGRQFQSLGSRLSSGTQATQQSISSDAQTQTTELPISPQDVLGIMQGNSAFMQQFEQSIEQSFSKLGDRVLDKWLKTTDTEMRKSINEITNLLGELTGEAVTGKNTLADSADHITSVLGRLVTGAATSALTRLLTRTKRTVSETDRSREESVRFRDSRGQQQADLSRELSKGKRYQ
jgi:hypothetical protein